MFINDGKTLFGNTGLIVSICILLILLMLSYNKCYKIDNFDNDTYPEPENVRVQIEASNIILNFNMNNSNTKIPSQFFIILAQYDNNKKNTGNNKFYLSNEYEISSQVSVDNLKYQTNVCSLIDGETKCSYKFSNLDIRDVNGNLFYYKIGVAAVYDNFTTSFIMPYNINTIDKLFNINSTSENQNKQYDDFLKYQANIDTKTNQTSTNIYNTTIATADGKYELIKSQLGNYPDSLLIDDQKTSQALLNDLVDKTMSQGIINIDVKMNN